MEIEISFNLDGRHGSTLRIKIDDIEFEDPFRLERLVVLGLLDFMRDTKRIMETEEANET